MTDVATLSQQARPGLKALIVTALNSNKGFALLAAAFIWLYRRFMWKATVQKKQDNAMADVALDASIVAAVEKQTLFFKSGGTRSLEWRQGMVKKLATCIIESADKISAAQEADGVRPSNFMGAAGMMTGCMYYYLSNMPKWIAPEVLDDTMPTERRQGIDCDWLAVSEPKGKVLNIAPWNAPTILSVMPCLGALAAGNTCVIKPPDAAPATSKLLAEIIAANMPAEAVTVVQGGPEVCTGLIDLGFDHIMFTGGTSIGKIIMKRAANHLTPCTLELGGKNPVFIDEMDDGLLGASIKEIVGTKVAFSGEFCQCHDVLLVLDSMYDRFVGQMTTAVEALGDRRMVRMIHKKHYDRVKDMLDNHKGTCVPSATPCDDEKLNLPVTMVMAPAEGDAIMQDEVFGPLWVVLRVASLDEAIQRATTLPTGKPLVSYYYGPSDENMDKWQACVSSGCMVMNAGPMRMQSNFNAAVHGVGNSGMGGASIWGKHVFDTFSHKKHVVRPRGGAFAGSIWGAGPYSPSPAEAGGYGGGKL